MLMTEESKNPLADFLFVLMCEELHFKPEITDALYSVLVEIESPAEQVYFFKEFILLYGTGDITVN